MPQPVSNTTTLVSGSLLAEKISYVVDGQSRNYRGGYGGLSWMSEAPAANNVIFIGNTTDIGRGPAGKPLFYPSYNTTQANIVYAVNKLPGSPGNFTTTASAYNWAVTNNFFVNNSDNPIPRIDADGLKFYVDANQPTSYPQTGTSWYDMSGNGINGTLTNGPTWNSNGWFVFDGTDDYVDTFNTFQFAQSGQFSVCGIINVQDHSFRAEAAAGIIGKGHYYSNSWDVWLYNNESIFFETSGDNSPSNVQYLASDPLTVGRWYFFAATYNNTAKNLWVNSSQYSNTYTGTGGFTNGNTVLIARRSGDAYRSLIGSGSAFSIYSRELSTTEIKQNYFQSNIVQDGLIFMVDANNLVSYPKSGTTVYNLTGSQVGTLTNGVGFSTNNGGYWTFDGVDDYIAVSSPQTLNPGTNSFTIEYWCYISPSLSDAGVSCALEARSTSNLYGFLSIAYYPGGYMSLFVNGANDPGQNVYTSTTAPVQKNTWIHQTAVVDRTTQQITFYYNGVQTGNKVNLTDTGTLDPGSGYTYYIGGDLGGSEMNGNIASLRQYNKALSASEVQQNYEATKDKFLGQNIVTNGLLLNLDAANKNSYPGTGTTWSNTVSTSYNATLYNGPIFNPSINTISLDGVDDYAASSVNSALSNVSTVVMLCYGTPSATDRMYCSFGGYDVYYYGGTNDRRLGFNTGNGDIYGCTGISDSTISGLTMYTFVFRTDVSYTNNEIWINTTKQSLSQLQGSENAGLRTFTIGNFHVGSWVYGGYYPNIGVISTLVYNRQLSSSEITQNYNAFRSKFGF